MSNIDLEKWIEYFGIKHFRGIFSRDNLPMKIKNKECGIINLDDTIGAGTHWVCYRNDEISEYFDPFGLTLPKEVEKYLNTSGLPLFYSPDEIQERNSVLCGYWCLYYLKERQNGKSISDVIHNPKFDFNDQMKNQKFIIDYFS